MITKTEVNEAIRECEPLAGWSSLDMAPVNITKGHLRILVEAAKKASFTTNAESSSRGPQSGAELVIHEW